MDDGSTTQIDHILITTSGVFVIETKHYKGWVFANEKSKFWTQCTYTGKYKFQNPIHQNYRHVKAVQKLFDFLDTDLIKSVIVFSGEAEFKTSLPNTVCYIDNLIPTIQHHQENKISLNRIQFCVGRLE